MSDTKKPTVSEIRARYEPRYAGDVDISYLLDLVSRMGKALETVALVNVYDERTKEAVLKARALVEEAKQ